MVIHPGVGQRIALINHRHRQALAGPLMLEAQTAIRQSPITIVEILINLPGINHQIRLGRVLPPFILPRAQMHRNPLQHPLKHSGIAILRLPLVFIRKIPRVVVLPPHRNPARDGCWHFFPGDAPLLSGVIFEDKIADFFVTQLTTKLALSLEVIRN
jgi:hypothetical protein